MTAADDPVEVGRSLLARAQWAARAFARYDRATVRRIVAQAVDAAAARSDELAERAVRETGLGVAEHKVVKNLACSRGLAETYADHDFVSPRIDPTAKIVEIPRPAGVILALTPSTNPVSTVFFKTILALMTRNAIVISPHPMAREVCADAARILGEAAVEAGAPDGVVQAVTEPSIPIVEALLSDPRTNLILATGGAAVVRAAYRSGNPAIGVGPGNVPVFVDHTADLERAATRIVASKSFDNSVLCTNESVLVAEDAIAERLLAGLRREGTYVLSDAERDRLRAGLFPGGRFASGFAGKDAAWIAEQVGLRVPSSTRMLLAPIAHVVPEEPLAHEKLCPVLALVRVPGVAQGIAAARAVVRLAGPGHSAAIHSRRPQTVMEYGAAVGALRVVVNVGASLGSSGLETNLAPSMTIGTGFVGGSSVGENLRPDHLIDWMRIAYNTAADEPFGDFSGLDPAVAPVGPVPAYPLASNLPTARDTGARPASGNGLAAYELREEIRRLILEELAQIARS